MLFPDLRHPGAPPNYRLQRTKPAWLPRPEYLPFRVAGLAAEAQGRWAAADGQLKLVGGIRMKFVVIGESSGATMDQLMAVYPRHKALVDQFVSRGEVIGIGPFTDRGNMAIFRSRQAAQEFVEKDPFALEGLVKSYVIREWNDSMLV